MKKGIIIFILCLIVIGIIVYFCIWNNKEEETTNIEPNNESETQNIVPKEEQIVAEIEQEWKWKKDIPENHRINETVFNNLHNTFDNTQILSFSVVKNGHIIDEYYKNGYDNTSIFALNSCSKSITDILVGIAIDKGYIENVNVPISNYFPEIQNLDNEYWKQITIEHLLEQTSGINITDDANWYEWRASNNWMQYIFDHDVTARPGTVFRYSTTNAHLLSSILQKATGMTAYEFGKQYLFEPLQIDTVECGTDAQGISDGGNGFRMNIYDMLKIGQLYLNKGVWEEEQIVSTKWVEDSTSLQFERSSGSADYGYSWWVRTFGEERYSAYFAQGHAGQYIFVVPDLELVIAFTSNHTGSSSMYWQFVNTIVEACYE